MAIDQGRWPLQIQGGGSNEYQNRVRSVSFGDGYQQITPEGINSEHIVVPIVYVGPKATALAVRDFLRSHVGKGFSIAPPNLPLGLYTVKADSVRDAAVSMNVVSVTATIETFYGFI